MKLKNKITRLIIIVLLSYPLAWTCYPKYLGYTIYLGDDSRHVIGYFVLGFFFNWLSLPCALLDEIGQLFVKNKSFNWSQVGSNILSALVGMGLGAFVKLSIRFNNPFRKR